MREAIDDGNVGNQIPSPEESRTFSLVRTHARAKYYTIVHRTSPQHSTESAICTRAHVHFSSCNEDERALACNAHDMCDAMRCAHAIARCHHVRCVFNARACVCVCVDLLRVDNPPEYTHQILFEIYYSFSLIFWCPLFSTCRRRRCRLCRYVKEIERKTYRSRSRFICSHTNV